MPAPRVLEPDEGLGCSPADGNRIIEGDNLQVMVSLRSQYRSSVDVAYLDPPYNTGKKDFRYSDRRFHDPNADSDDAVYVSNEDGGRHTKWLNYMGPRLWLTWELLADHGVCFVSISDVELFRLGLLLDEIFGERNRLGVLVWKQAVDNNPTQIAVEHEYVLCYAKRIESVADHWQGTSRAKQWLLDKYAELKTTESDPEKLQKRWRSAIAAQRSAYRRAVAEGRPADELDLGRMDRFRNIDPRGPWAKDWHLEKPYEGGYFYDIPHPVTGKACRRPPRGYRYPWESMQRLLADDRIVFGKDHTETAQLRRYLRDSAEALRSVIVIPGRNGSDRLTALLRGDAARFPHPKPVELMELLIGAAGDLDALVLDPFAGSGTTGEAVLKLNQRDGGLRRFILIEEGEPADRYCRTVTVPRVRAVIEHERLSAGFIFEATGRKLDREAILELERATITNLILQTDVTGVGSGIQKVSGEYVIGANARREAICLCWNGRKHSTVSRDVLIAMFEEAKALQLHRPLRVYGSTCEVGETDSFRFCQIPDAILAALQLVEETDDDEPEQLTEALEALEQKVQSTTTANSST
jgi:adenine-specific DNA-methyltransferase